MVTHEESETLRWVAAHLESVKAKHDFAKPCIDALVEIYSRGKKGQPGRVGEAVWFRFWLEFTKSWSEWLPGSWLAWSTWTDASGKVQPAAIVEVNEGEICVMAADGIRFSPPPKTP